jgi:hypothetical protein
MTREEAKKLVPIVQAFADGKTIQLRTGVGWQDIEDPVFAGPISIYRIKPEPRRLYFIELKSGKLRLYGDCPPRMDAKTEDEKFVEFVEVMSS